MIDGGSIVGVKSLVLGTSFVSYMIYKRYEPSSVGASFILLVLLPGVLVSTARDQFSSTVIALASVYVSYWLSLLAFVVGYRLSPIHPLATYPGPILCKLSKIWLAYIYSQGTGHHYHRDLHAKYGDVVRIRPNELSFRHEDVVNPILKDTLKGPYYTTRQSGPVAQLDGLPDPASYARRRKAWTKGTSLSALKGYEELLRDVLRELLTALEKFQGESIDLSAWLSYSSFDFMGEMALSKEFGNVKNGSDNTGVIHAIDQGVLLALANQLFGEAWAWKTLQNFGAETVRQRMANGSNRRDLFHHLMDEDGLEPVKPSVEEVTSDGILAIIAGSDTAAMALAHVFYFLLRYPECMKRLRGEIDTEYPLPSDPLLDFGKQAEMPYLNACINEAMRLYPPVLSGLQRRVDTGSGGNMIGQYYVPDGTQVSASLFSMQRDSRYFYPLPDEFWPDRFLDQENYVLPSGTTISKKELVHNRNVFAPFSAGPRSCVGRSIAVLEMRAVLCAVLHKFDIFKADGFNLDDWEKGLQDHYITTHGPLMVKLKARW